MENCYANIFHQKHSMTLKEGESLPMRFLEYSKVFGKDGQDLANDDL